MCACVCVCVRVHTFSIYVLSFRILRKTRADRPGHMNHELSIILLDHHVYQLHATVS